MSRGLGVVLATAVLAAAGSARAEHLRPAFNPRLHIRPPTMRTLDGGTSELMIDADFLAAAARYRAQHPAVHAASAGVTTSGEVVLVQPDDQIVSFDGTSYGLTEDGLAIVAQRVIAQIGDNYQAITIWMTFPDRSSVTAAAYEMPVKNEVQGLGKMLPVEDASAAYGSHGVLRSMLNMKTVGLTAGDTSDSWLSSLQIWGQESAHRWLVFFLFRDPRDGHISDVLLGRDCAHYSRYIETQASVHDGFAWTDNGDGSFTWTEFNQRYSGLDLYGMGLLAPDEVQPFFLIDNIPGYTYPTSCVQYGSVIRIPAKTVTGTRVNITIDDVIAANGPRKVPTPERQDYWREAEVVLMSPAQTPTTPEVQQLATRINSARMFWEQWVLGATRKRLVMCTQTSADCGDPRSDVSAVTLNPDGKAPSGGPLPLEVQVTNTGARQATGVTASIEVTVTGAPAHDDSQTIGTLDPGATKMLSFPVDLRTVACGTPVGIKAATQSDFHFNRNVSSVLLGAADRFTDGFETDSGWTIDPDGDDTQVGAQWERGQPEATVLLQQTVQPGEAHGGTAAWVTGLAANPPGMRASLVRNGKATLQSPLYATDGLRDPELRYWVSFAGVRADSTGQALEPSPQSSLVVLARGVDAGDGGAPAATDWEMVDTLSGAIAPDWAQRTAPLPKDILQKSQLQLRFVATDANPEQGGVEAAIDDIEITSNLAACYQPPPSKSGGGCQMGGRPTGAGLLLLALAAIIAHRRIRRAR